MKFNNYRVKNSFGIPFLPSLPTHELSKSAFFPPQPPTDNTCHFAGCRLAATSDAFKWAPLFFLFSPSSLRAMFGKCDKSRSRCIDSIPFFSSRTSKGKQLVLYATKELATIAPQFPGRMTNVSLIFALRHKSSSS